MHERLGFRDAFMLFFRQISPHVPVDDEALRKAGIGVPAAFACIALGMAVALVVTLGGTWLFLQAVSNGIWLVALVFFVPVFVLVQGAVTVTAYRFWIRLKSP